MTFVPNANGVMASVTRPTLGLTASFTTSVTVNTTGTTALAANTGRQVGVWLQCTAASVQGLVGSSISNATFIIAPPGATNSWGGLFVPGTGAIYVKTASGITNFNLIEY